MDNEKNPIYFNISVMTVIKIVLVFILFYFLYIIKDILAILFVSLIFASAIDPLVDFMHRRRIPKAIGVVIIYLSLLAVVITILALIIPPIVEQLIELSNNFPAIIDKVLTSVESLRKFSGSSDIIDSIQKSFGTVSDNLQNAAGGLFATIANIFGGIFSFLLVMVLTFYMTVEDEAIKKLVWSIAPTKHQVYVMHLVNRMQSKIGLWLRGQLILSFTIFLMTFVGLSILGVKYALILALISGVTESVPFLGPILSGIPAVFLAFTQRPTLAIFVAILYYIIQIIENHIIVPKVMQKVVGLHPIVSIAAIMIGFQIGGIIGALISIPVTTAINVFIKDVFDQKAVSDREINN